MLISLVIFFLIISYFYNFEPFNIMSLITKIIIGNKKVEIKIIPLNCNLVIFFILRYILRRPVRTPLN